MKKVFLVALAIIVVSGLIFSGCAAPAPPAPPIKIGHIRPLTGHMAITGERMIRAGDFAFEEAEYEVAGRKVEVIVADSGADPAMAMDAAKKLIEHDKVAMIIGPTVGGTQMAVSAYMNGVGTVSYTHLRAHETLRYLVCRLLLEKKKTSIRFLSQFHEFGIRDRMPLTADFHGSFFAPFILNELPPEAAEAIVGEYCPTPYTPLLETDVNKRFVEAWTAKIGEAPEDTDTGPYEGVLVALAALEATGGDTSPEKLRQAILGLELEGPQGPIHFDPGTHCALKTIYIGEVQKIGEEYVWAPAHAYPDVPPFGLCPPPGPPPGGPPPGGPPPKP